jgi:hypothetical protein
MRTKYRIVDNGYFLTIGRVTFDPNGLPECVTLNVLTALTTSELHEIIANIQIDAFTTPALILAEVGCEVMNE